MFTDDLIRNLRAMLADNDDFHLSLHEAMLIRESISQLEEMKQRILENG